MSFFLEAKRNTDFPIHDAPSPFEYTVNVSKRKTHSFAPFGTTSKLNRDKIKQNVQEQQIKQIQNDKVLFIDDTNVKLVPQLRMNSMFKSGSQRIVNVKNNVPGPGSYELRSKYKKLKNNNLNHSHQSVQTSLNMKTTTPSIPIDNLGYKYTKNQEFEKVRQPQQTPPVPGSYEVAKDLFTNKGLSWSVGSLTNKRQKDDFIPGPGAYNVKPVYQTKTLTSCFNSQSTRFNEKKLKKSYQPGPGEYEVSQNRLKRAFSQSHFNSKSTRFPQQKSINKLGPGAYIKDRSKSMKTFNKKVLEGYQQKVDNNRKTIFSTSLNNNPGPGQYISRQGMTFQLQKALIRKHNLSQFSNSQRAVFDAKDQDEPGPGSYDVVRLKGTQKGNLGYKKVDIVNLKAGQQCVTPSPFHYVYNNHTIVNKVEKTLKRLTLTEKKPFNQGSQRFDYNQSTSRVAKETITNFQSKSQIGNNLQCTLTQQFEGPKKVKKLIMTSVKVKVPFGSSASKHGNEEINYIGPGSYNENLGWIKQTHSIKAKLNKKL